MVKQTHRAELYQFQDAAPTCSVHNSVHIKCDTLAAGTTSNGTKGSSQKVVATPSQRLSLRTAQFEAFQRLLMDRRSTLSRVKVGVDNSVRHH